MSHPSLADKAFVVTGEVSQWPKLVHFHGGVDVSSRSEVTRVYQDITAISPKLYGLANCAGISEIGHGYVEPDEIFEKVMAVNTFGVFYMTTAFLKLIHDETPNTGPPKTGAVPEGRGSIVNIGSNASYMAYPMMTGYVASKHAVLGMTRSWAVDWIHAGVRVNLVAPGGTDTPMMRAQAKNISETTEVDSDGQVRGSDRELPMGRVARPEEMANVILFLLSDNASYINGQMLKVNGGWP